MRGIISEPPTRTDISCLLVIKTKERREYGVSSYHSEAIAAGDVTPFVSMLCTAASPSLNDCR